MNLISNAQKHYSAINAGYKPQTAVTDWVERLCSSSYKVTEYEGIPELVESINLQASGPGEAARTLRKKLKYGNTHMQLRAIFLIKSLVENCGERTNFQRNFPDPTLVERLKIIAGDPQTDPVVKKTLLGVLKGFNVAYREDRSMKVYGSWWEEVGGARGEEDARAKEAYKKEQARLDAEQQLRLDEKMAQRLQGEEDEHARKLREERDRRRAMKAKMEKDKEEAQKREEQREKERLEKERVKEDLKNRNKGLVSSVFGSGTSSSTTTTKGKRVPFNFEQEKPKIAQSVAEASMHANGLVNALQHVNREKESVSSNTRVQDELNKLKDTRKRVVRYIQLCEADTTGEYIGMLISSNDQIIAALRLYDRMLTKPADDDSDDEPVMKKAKELSAQEAAASSAKSPDSSSNADSLSGNLEKVKLNNPSVQTFGELDKLRDRQRTEILRENRNRHAAGLPTPGIYGDLAGINWGNNGGSLQAPMNPKHAVETKDPYGQGNLSDYSDYSSSDEEDYRPSKSSNNRGWRDFVDEKDSRSSKLIDDDPFGDDAGVSTPIYEKPRAHVWAEI